MDKITPLLAINSDLSIVNNSTSPDHAISLIASLVHNILESTALFFEEIKEYGTDGEDLTYDGLKESILDTLAMYRMEKSGFTLEESMKILGKENRFTKTKIEHGKNVDFEELESNRDCKNEAEQTK